MAPPATAPSSASGTAAGSPVDIEDYGSVLVNQKCTGCVACRILAPDIFLEAHAGSKDPTVRTS